nr:hypothetical protein [Tanacetum cinerariifolium]
MNIDYVETRFNYVPNVKVLSFQQQAFRLGPNLCILFIMGGITDIKYVLTQKALTIFCETYHIPDEVHSQLHSPNQTIHEMPSGKIGVYTSISFEVLCRVHGFEPTVGLFRCFYVNSKNIGWMSFGKRLGNDVVCYTKPLDSLKNWNDRFFLVDTFACLASFPWSASKGLPKDHFSKSFEFNAEHYATLVAHPAPFHKYPKPFFCLVGISRYYRYYTLDENTYPGFLGDDDEEMDLVSFIRTADPTKGRVAERQRAKDEPRLLKTTVGRIVPLLPLVIATTDTIVKYVAPLQPRRQRKRKIVVADASRPSHPSKKLREDNGSLGEDSAVGKSRSAVQIMFAGVVLNAEARGEPILTFPFVTSFVSATPERKDKSPADSVTGLNLRTIGAPQRFVISSDSSHHSGANIAEAEVDSIVRSSAPAIATVTTVTATVDAATTADGVPVERSLFSVGLSSTGRTDSVPYGFLDVSGSDFLIGVYVSQWSVTNGFGLDDSRICREMLEEFAPPKFFASIHGMDHDQLFTEFNVGAARQISLSAEVRMCAEYNIREKIRLRSIVDEQAELLKVRDGEIENLKAQLLLKEAEAAEAIRLRAEVLKFEATEKSLQGKVEILRDHSATLEKYKNELSLKVTDLQASVKVREQEVADLDAQVTAVKLQNDNLVHELEISFAGLQEKVVVYEDFIGQLEKFQDEKMEVNEKFDKLCAEFVEMALHLEEKFYLRLLTTIYGRRWLLTHSIELSIVKCLNSTEYMSALGAAITKAVEKGMQEGLSAGITHDTEGRNWPMLQCITHPHLRKLIICLPDSAFRMSTSL